MTCLKVFIEGECSTVLDLLLCLFFGDLLCAGHDAGFLVISHTLLEEVGLSSKRDVIHKVEWVGSVVVLGESKSNQQPIRDEFDILAHQSRVHTEKSNRKCVGQEFLLDGDSLGDNCQDICVGGWVLQLAEEQAGEVRVETLITGNELVGECEARHESTLLQPEDGSERTAEEDTFNSSKGNDTVGKGRFLVIDPAESPVSLLADTGN